MIRVVTAVVLAAALVAASLPAVEEVRTERTAARLDADVERMHDAARSLLATDEAVEGIRGARRVVRIRLPPGTLTGAGVVRFELDCRPQCVAGYELADGTVTRRHLPDLPLRPPRDGLQLGGPGVHRLVLRLRLVDGRRVVAIEGA